MKRRTFVKSVSAASLLAGLPLKATSWNFNNLDILVLGGRDFLGPAIVESAVTRGHQVTLFNRNKTNTELFNELTLMVGDRDKRASCYEILQQKQWDVVIDVWPQKSQLVDEATKALQNNTNHYIFISSIAVYADYSQIGLSEESAVVELGANRSSWGYSEEKAEGENFIIERFPERHTILRPGPIKGWRDPAMDLAYWLLRFKHNSKVLAPGTGDDPIQFIDVKDVGRFTIACAEHNNFGIFNTTGPRTTSLTFREFLESCKTHTHSQAEIVWVDESFLRQQKVRSFDDLPLWAPLTEDPGFMQISNRKANQRGFQYSTLNQTYSDILNWYEVGLGGSHKFGRENESVGLTVDRERELLNLWQG